MFYTLGFFLLRKTSSHGVQSQVKLLDLFVKFWMETCDIKRFSVYSPIHLSE